METDYLIIGSGIAGLTFALKVADYHKERNEKKSITILTKASKADETNTKYAQGGIAAVHDLSKDSYYKHIEDTLIAGDGLCKESIVEMVVKEGPSRIEEIIRWGTTFDKTPEGEFDLAREGGHSESRIYHHKDVTGAEVERALLRKVDNHPLIEIHSNFFAIDLITQHHLGAEITRRTPDTECYGAYVLNKNTGQIEKLLSRITMLATGGAGQVYKNTTNPVIATGDGIAMAYRAKAMIENMEFIQFHPTALYNPADNPCFLISEAVRGLGAELKTQDGQAFMHKYDDRGSLAPRDIVARAIDNELKQRGDHYVFLDATITNHKELLAHFPNIAGKCKSIGIDICKDMIPVVPATHYTCGGIQADKNGKTTIHRLYACGECSCTGLHGANRLASNSLLEALVFAHRSYLSAVEELQRFDIKSEVPDWNAEGTTVPRERVVINHNIEELKDIMGDYVGIVRSDRRLSKALSRLKIIYDETKELYDTSVLSPQLCELRNLVNIAYLITTFAMKRKESRGLHYNIDHPEKLEEIVNTTL